MEHKETVARRVTMIWTACPYSWPSVIRPTLRTHLQPSNLTVAPRHFSSTRSYANNTTGTLARAFAGSGARC